MPTNTNFMKRALAAVLSSKPRQVRVAPWLNVSATLGTQAQTATLACHQGSNIVTLVNPAIFESLAQVGSQSHERPAAQYLVCN